MNIYCIGFGLVWLVGNGLFASHYRTECKAVDAYSVVFGACIVAVGIGI